MRIHDKIYEGWPGWSEGDRLGSLNGIYLSMARLRRNHNIEYARETVFRIEPNKDDPAHDLWERALRLLNEEEEDV